MTEEEWLACAEVDSLLAFLQGRASERKLRLFGCACCWRIAHLFRSSEFIRTIDVTERYANGQATQEEFRRSFKVVEDHIHAQTPEHGVSCAAEFPVIWASATWYESGCYPTDAAQHCAECARGAIESRDPEYQARLAAGPPEAELPYPFTKEQVAEFMKSFDARSAFVRSEKQQLQAREAGLQVAFLRDIFGNPFRPATLDPAGLTTDVAALARAIYDERVFDRMPILADALQGAGCNNDDILNHCRDTSQVHVRGCWVIDLLTGRG